MTYRVLALLATLMLCACGSFESERPGDEQTQVWVEPDDCESRTVIDCAGATRGFPVRPDDCTTFRDCVFEGTARIKGTYSSGGRIDGELSRSEGYVDWIRSDAPRDITLENCTAPRVYVGPGAVRTTLDGVTITGEEGCTVALYLDAESTLSTIRESTIDATQCDRAVAFDATDNSTFANNLVVGGGLQLYRNCGESGVTRHTTPSRNTITGNTFRSLAFGEPAVWLGKRSLKNLAQAISGTGFCGDDDGSEWGSSQSDLDWARDNVVTGNAGGAVFESPTFDVYNNEVDG